MTRDERLVGGYPGRMLAVTALGWSALQLARFAVPPLLPEIRADLGLSLSTAGVALTVFQAVYAVCQYPSGRLSDDWSRATLLAPSFVVLGVGCLMLGGAVGLPTLLAAMAVFGVGKGLYAIPSRALLSDLFVEHRGRALGIYSAGTDLGGILAAGAAAAAIAVATWRVVFAPVAVLLFALLAPYVVWNREPHVAQRTDLEALATLRRLLATPRQRWTITAFVCFYVMVTGVLNFLPEYLRVAKGFSPALASAAFALVFVVGLAVKPAAGAVSDRFPRRTVAAGGLLVGAAALTAILLVGSTVAVAVFAVGYKTEFPVIDAILLDADAGADLGAARTLFLGAGSVGPAFVGAVADRLDFTAAFAAMAALVVVAGVLLWTARYPRSPVSQGLSVGTLSA